MWFFAIMTGVKDFIARHKTLMLYLLAFVLIAVVVSMCRSWYHAQLKAQYDAGYKTAVVATDAKWTAQFKSQKDANDLIVDQLHRDNSARADKWHEDILQRDQKIQALLEKQSTILARDNKGQLLKDASGKPEQCFMGQDFADAWNKINSVYGLDN